MITIQDLTLQRGSKPLFEGASLQLFAGQRVGLIGINGSGKSTLFALLMGRLQPDTGAVSLTGKLRIGHLAQEIPTGTLSALQFVMTGDEELTQVRDAIQRAEAAADHLALAHLHTQLSNIDGYSAEARAGQLLNGLGFAPEEHEQSVDAFSGGWRMRLNLARVLMSRSDLLLLDEPTNHLDIDAIAWLETWLKRYAGTLLIISHDRDFLDNTIDHIVHITKHRLTLYAGNYSGFERQRASTLATEQAMYEKQQREMAHLEKFIARFRYKATKAKQVQSRIKQLEKMERVVLSHIDSPFHFEFFEPKPCRPPLLELDRVSFGYENQLLFENSSFQINPGDRIGLLGPNGVGKSSLMTLLKGESKPLKGKRSASRSIAIGYFAQHQVEQLNYSLTACEQVARLETGMREQAIRNYLGGFGFSGDMALTPVENFSGGEKARLVLALIIARKPNLLLLDEPTNHLDLDMREALSYALQSYTGAMVLVSHDRHLLRSTVDSFYLIQHQTLQRFDGDLDDYQRLITEKVDAPLRTSVTKPAPKQQDRETRLKLQKLEQRIEKLSQEKSRLEKALAEDGLYLDENRDRWEALLQKYRATSDKLAELEARWYNLV